MTDPRVDDFITQTKQWKKEYQELRKIVRACDLDETLKWKQPCYTHNDKNIVLIAGLKDSCMISFLKGALLKDPKKLLIAPGENSQSARIIRFTNVKQIKELADTIKAYIAEAIDVEQSGKKIEKKSVDDYEIPEELEEQFDASSEFKKAFEALTPGRRRAYLMHFDSAKQSKTKTARIEKCKPRILDGFGLNDCTCGHSKKMPGCDGSHKFI